ncbi:glycosyltransferase family 4 protein [Maribacter arcticus]|uniref:glycosyltransferase family 4 protein n=1 Tax=Maribacter arcticus TaxID=561365 RepID=UPI003001703D
MIKSKIAFVIPSLSAGGAERVVSTLCNELVLRYDITIIIYTKTVPFYELDSRINLVYCRNNNSQSINVWQGIKNNYLLYRKIVQIVKKNKIDLIIGFMTNSNILTVLAGKTLGLPTIISERIDPSNSQTNAIWKKLKKFLYPMANSLVVQTQPIKSYFSKWLPENKLIILPNPLVNTFSQAKEKRVQPIKENIVLNVGRLTTQKGQERLIRSFAKINPDNWKLQLVGSGPLEAIYRRLINDLNMNDKIELLGLQQDIIPYYQKAKIFAFPSLYEGFPNALTEAMYMGLACISTDCPTGPSELIKNGLNGYLVPMKNHSEFEEKLNMLILNQNLVKIFSEKAPLAVTHLETKNVVAQWEILIKKVILS